MNEIQTFGAFFTNKIIQKFFKVTLINKIGFSKTVQYSYLLISKKQSEMKKQTIAGTAIFIFCNKKKLKNLEDKIIKSSVYIGTAKEIFFPSDFFNIFNTKFCLINNHNYHMFYPCPCKYRINKDQNIIKSLKKSILNQRKPSI